VSESGSRRGLAVLVLGSLKGFGEANEVGDSTIGATSVVVLSSVEERTDWAPCGENAVERPFVIEMGGGTLMDLLDDLRRRREGNSSVRIEGLEEPALVRWTSSRKLPVDEAGVNDGRFKGMVAVFAAEGLEGLDMVLSDTDNSGLDGDLTGASCESEAFVRSFTTTWGVSGWTSDPSPLRVPSSELFDQPERDEERGDGGMMVTMGWKLGAGEGLREDCSAPMALPRSSDCLWAVLMTMLGTAVAFVVVGAAILLRAGEGVRPRRRESNDRLEFSLLCDGD
jgi:hypothetical protein